MTKLVECRHLTCAYGNAVVVKDVDLAITSGEFVGVVGPSGSGKTTLLKAILKSIAPTHGHIDHSPGLRLAYVPQVETVDWNFPVTVTEVVVMTQSQGRWWPRITNAERAATEHMLERLGLGGLGNRHIRELSGGQQQRVAVARALATQPRIIFADEPTGNVDSTTGTEILTFMRRAVDELGQTIVMVTHDPVSAAFADRIIFLADGKIVDEMLEPTAVKVLDRMKSLGT